MLLIAAYALTDCNKPTRFLLQAPSPVLPYKELHISAGAFDSTQCAGDRTTSTDPYLEKLREQLQDCEVRCRPCCCQPSCTNLFRFLLRQALLHPIQQFMLLS